LRPSRKVVLVVASLVILRCSVAAQSDILFPPDFKIGPPKAAIIGAIVGVAAVTGVVLYVTLHKPSITGCTLSANGINSVTDEKDKLNYVLSDQNLKLAAGERVKLRGKKRKDKSGNLIFQVKKVKRDYGLCQPRGRIGE
jgi:hypothetical protein